MKKTLSNILMTVILMWGMTACTNLDETLYSEIPESIYPENEQQASLILLPAYDKLQGWTDWAGWWFAQEVTSDEVVCPTRHTDWDDGGKWRELHLHTWNNETEALKQMWPNYFEAITACNKIADMFDPASDNPTVQLTIAKLKIIRAYYYYCAIDNYGDVPYLTSFADAPQQPYKTRRATVFNNIVQEIEASIPYLPSGQGSKNAVNRGMAFSLLAKLYLNAAVYTGTPQWAKAEAACDSVIALNYSLEGDVISPFKTTNESSPENIFTIAYDENLKKDFNLHMRTLHYNHNEKYNMTVSPWNGFAVIGEHYDRYDEADRRKAGYFLAGPQTKADGTPLIDGETGQVVNLTKEIPALYMNSVNQTLQQIRCSGIRACKFEVKVGAGQDLSNDFPIFRYADILLMKAEAMVRQSKNGDSYINEVRGRAGITPLTNVTLEQILDERAREMFWEGHRRQDLIRFGKFAGVNNNRWSDQGSVVPAANELIFTIPREQTDKNPNLLLDPID